VTALPDGTSKSAEAFLIDGTNNTAELSGLLLALQRHRDVPLAVITDSEITAFAYRYGCSGNVTLVNMIRLEMEARRLPVFILKTTSHPLEKGVPPTILSGGNDAADLLAEIGTFLHDPLPESTCTVRRNDSPYGPPLHVWHDRDLPGISSPAFVPSPAERREAVAKLFGVNLKASRQHVKDMVREARLCNVPAHLLKDYRNNVLLGQPLRSHDMEVGGISVWWHSQRLHTYAELVELGRLPDGAHCEPTHGMRLDVTHDIWPHDQTRSPVTRPLYVGKTHITVTWE
jgi:hypothetical protein